jgi:peptide deformylase
MAVREIVKWPDSRLRQETIEIKEITADVRALYRDLCDTMFADNGVGIAAIQIGDPAKMFLIEASVVGRDADDPPLAFLNPSIEWISDEKETAEEGCLSFPGIYVPIERSSRVRIRATNLDGEALEIEGGGLLARALQHEYDHLNGRLMVDFVGPLKKQMIKRRLRRRAEEDAAPVD